MDHFLNQVTQLSINNIFIHEDIFDCPFTLVARYRATSAKLQDFDEDINIELEATKGSVAKEEQALEKIFSKH